MIHARNARPHPTLETDHGDDWRARAACLDHDPELWFSDVKSDRDEARAICKTCPVRAQCEVRGTGERWGIWAGVSKEPGRADELPETTPCPFCGTVILTGNLGRHTRATHGLCQRGHVATPGKCVPCARERTREYMRSVRAGEDDPLECRVCGEHFRSERAVALHTSVAHDICAEGHDLTGKGSRRPRGGCAVCARARDLERYYAKQARREVAS